MKKEKLQLIVNITYAIVFLLLIVFAIYICLAEHNSVYQARPIDKCTILQDYSEITVEDSSAPAGIRKEYRFKLSDIDITKDYLAFYVVHHYAEVFIDDELVYSLVTDENNRICTSPSSNWIFIPLENSDSGREVLVTLTPVYKSVANRKVEFMIGSRSDITLKRLKTDLPQIVLSILCIFMGIILMIIQTSIILRKKSNSWELFHLGNFLLLIGIWRISDTRFSPILFFENTMALGYIAIAVLFICSVPFMLFVKEHFSGRKKTICLLTAFACCIIAFVALFCQVFKIAQLREMLTLCHIMLLVCIVVILSMSLVHADKKSDKMDLRTMAVLLSLGVIADLLYYYLEKSSSGVVFTVFALLIYTIMRFIKQIFNINRKVYIDAQTGLYNRSKWNDMMENSEQTLGTTGVMMMDLNCLKNVNDTMGHEMGDKMIVGFADILRRTLPIYCKIFRWGDDEFTVLVPDTDKDKMNKYVSDICESVEAHNMSGEKPEIHFAVGYALSTDYPTLSCEELMKKADEEMYHNKSEWYHKNMIED